MDVIIDAGNKYKGENLLQRLLNDKNNGCHDFELLYYRILTIIGGCTPPIFGYFYKKINPNAIDPISIQLIFTALFFIAFILTFYLSYRKYIRVFITVISYLFIVWLVIFNIINRFPSEHALTLICLLSILTLWFNSIEKVHLYVCPLIFIIFVSVYMVTETQIMKQVFLYLLCAFFAFSYLVARAKYKLQQKLMASEMFKRTIFEESPDALIIVDNDTDEIIECNGKAMALFNVKEKNDLIGENYYTIAGFRDYNIDISRVKSMIDSEGIWEKEFLVGSEVGKSMCNAITLKKLMILEQMYV
jgi:PAS domain-containing protein